jgi:hypothetical protein
MKLREFSHTYPNRCPKTQTVRKRHLSLLFIALLIRIRILYTVNSTKHVRDAFKEEETDVGRPQENLGGESTTAETKKWPDEDEMSLHPRHKNFN